MREKDRSRKKDPSAYSSAPKRVALETYTLRERLLLYERSFPELDEDVYRARVYITRLKIAETQSSAHLLN